MDFRFSQLFDQFNTVDSYTILTMLLIAFLLGLTVGILLRGASVSRYRRENEKLKREAAARQTELTTLRTQLNKTKTDLEEAQQLQLELEQERTALREEVAATTRRAQVAEQEKQDLLQETENTFDRLEQLEAANQTYLGTIEDLNNRLVGLQAQNERLSNAAPPSSPARDRLEAIERKMTQLEAENSALKRELRSLQTGAGAPQAGQADNGGGDLLPFTPFGGAVRDDLTAIDGIDAELEARLHRLGVYSFEHISRWDDAQRRAIADQLGQEGAQERLRHWVAQARRLWQRGREAGPEPSVSVAAPEKADDLQLIEGIGPKIESLLAAAGIRTHEQLADTPVARLRTILDSGGDHYQLHDPTTWPIQARLASNGEWELLRDYQEQLKGGREKQEEE